MKLRYRKAGIDMKQIINTLKSENVVNTRALLDSVEKLNSNKETIEVEHLWREHRLDNSPGESPDVSIYFYYNFSRASLNKLKFLIK